MHDRDKSAYTERSVLADRDSCDVPVHSKELGRAGGPAGQAGLCSKLRIADVDSGSSRQPSKAAAAHQRVGRHLSWQRPCEHWTLLQRTPDHSTPPQFGTTVHYKYVGCSVPGYDMLYPLFGHLSGPYRTTTGRGVNSTCWHFGLKPAHSPLSGPSKVGQYF